MPDIWWLAFDMHFFHQLNSKIRRFYCQELNSRVNPSCLSKTGVQGKIVCFFLKISICKWDLSWVSISYELLFIQNKIQWIMEFGEPQTNLIVFSRANRINVIYVKFTNFRFLLSHDTNNKTWIYRGQLCIINLHKNK